MYSCDCQRKVTSVTYIQRSHERKTIRSRLLYTYVCLYDQNIKWTHFFNSYITNEYIKVESFSSILPALKLHFMIDIFVNDRMVVEDDIVHAPSLTQLIWDSNSALGNIIRNCVINIYIQVETCTYILLSYKCSFCRMIQSTDCMMN